MRPTSIPTRVANRNYSPSVELRLSRRLCELGLGVSPSHFIARCGPELARLESLPDGALRSMGLRRSDALDFVVARALG
jgi:hypothetical protein